MTKSIKNDKIHEFKPEKDSVVPVLSMVLDSIAIEVNLNSEISMIFYLLDILVKDNHQRFSQGKISEATYLNNLKLCKEIIEQFGTTNTPN